MAPAIFRELDVPGAPAGPLAGLRFVVKDVIDVAGVPTTAGSRAWAATHPAVDRSARVVDLLLASGASLIGKTISDELAFSLNGTNPHFGTPRNPAGADRMPGGSSSGSASAVAGGECDFALGTDTGGSIRVPASYCGVMGFRPTWGRVPLSGVVPLSPSFDTVGWLARDARTMLRVGEVLLGEQAASRVRPLSVVPLTEAFALVDDEVAGSVGAALESLFPDRLRPGRRLGVDLAEWARLRGVIQTYETWRLHGEWAQQHAAELGRGVGARLLASAQTTQAEYDRACADREAICALLDDLVAPGEVLCLPAAPAPAPALASSPEQLRRQRDRLFPLVTPAALWGAPQICLPACRIGGLPVGLGLLARPHEDISLLALTCAGEEGGAR